MQKLEYVFFVNDFLGLIFAYYVVFYSCLAAFWVGMLSVLIYGLTDEKIPRLTGMQSLLKLKPGIIFAELFSLNYTTWLLEYIF